MLACAETQARIENDDRLIFTRLALDPTRFDQQRVADLNRLEMPFPGLRPVLAAHLGRFDFAGTDVQAAAFDSLEAG